MELQQTPPPAGGLRRGTLVRLQRVVQQARGVNDKVWVAALASGLAGAWLWGVGAYPFAFGSAGLWVLALLVLVLLLLPAAVLTLFYLGLNQIINLPDDLSALRTTGVAQAGTLYAEARAVAPAAGAVAPAAGAVAPADGDAAVTGPRRRSWRLFRSVFGLGRLLLESKELLIGSVAMVRLLNPLTLLVLVGATLLSLVLVGAAVLSVFVVLLF